MNEADPLILILRDHMRVAVEGDNVVKCWCGERFNGGDAHRSHVAVIVREYMAVEIDDGSQ